MAIRYPGAWLSCLGEPALHLPKETPLRAPFAVKRRPDIQLEVLSEPGRAVPSAKPESPIFPSIEPDLAAHRPSPHATPASPDHLYELGLTAAAMSYHTAAIEVLRDCTARAPDHAPAWHKLAEMFRLAGEDGEADAAEVAARACEQVKWKKGVDARPLPHLQEAERELIDQLKSRPEEDVAVALRGHLMTNPLDAVAMRFLARLEKRAGDEFTARALYE